MCIVCDKALKRNGLRPDPAKFLQHEFASTILLIKIVYWELSSPPELPANIEESSQIVMILDWYTTNRLEWNRHLNSTWIRLMEDACVEYPNRFGSSERARVNKIGKSKVVFDESKNLSVWCIFVDALLDDNRKLARASSSNETKLFWSIFPSFLRLYVFFLDVRAHSTSIRSTIPTINRQWSHTWSHVRYILA